MFKGEQGGHPQHLAIDDIAIADPDDSSLARVRWSGSALTAPYSLVEMVFDRGCGRRMQREGSGWQLRPPAYVYAQSRGVLRFAGESTVAAIAFRVSPIVASSLLSRPPAEIWNEPVAIPELVGSKVAAPCNRTTLADDHAQHLFNQVLLHAPLETLDLLSNQLGWSMGGLRRLFARSATLSSGDVDLIRRQLDASSMLTPPIQRNLVHPERVRALKLA